ncbi:MAG: B-4DMT family transporter [Mycobacterium sp.]
MTSWMLRGLVFAGGMVLVRLVQGALINTYENKASMISLTLVALFGIAPIVWGFLDGRSDAKDNWDPDRRRDLAMRWLNAGLFAGVVSGAVAWIISLFYENIYADDLLNELTTFAAFTALLVFIPAVIAVAIGRLSIDRGRPEMPRRRVTDEGAEDIDVFEAARDNGATAAAE